MLRRIGEGVFHVELSASNAYLVEDADGWTLVDAGLPRDAGDLRAALGQVEVAPPELARVLLTHADADHVGGLPALVGGTDVPVFAGRWEVELLRGQRDPPWTNLRGWIQRLAGRFVLDPLDADLRVVEDGARVGGFRAFHTPGHSPGHVVFVHGDHAAAFAGDLVRTKGGSLRRSPWYTNHDTGRVERSVQELAHTLPDVELLCPGHGDPLEEHGSAELKGLAAALDAGFAAAAPPRSRGADEKAEGDDEP